MKSARLETRTVAATFRMQCSSRFKRLTGLILVALVMTVCGARAQDPDDHYLSVLTLIHQADVLKAGGKSGAALAAYRKAQTKLGEFQRNNPQWNRTILSYRINYLADKIAALSENPATTAEKTAGGAEGLRPGKGAMAGSGAEVKLTDAGAEPRQVLRFHPKPGDKQALSMVLKMAVATKVGEMETPAMKMPAMTLPMETTVKAVSAEGDIWNGDGHG